MPNDVEHALLELVDAKTVQKAAKDLVTEVSGVALGMFEELPETERSIVAEDEDRIVTVSGRSSA